MSVFCWGTSDDGAMGIPFMQNASTRRVKTQEELLPSRIDSLRDHEIVDIIAGDSHSLAIDSTGTLYSWFTSACFANLLFFKLIIAKVNFFIDL
jgi:alpha-tubulin suppressor-like RCC1 family protein